MADWIDQEITHSYDAAVRAGAAGICAVAARYDSRKKLLVVVLNNGVILMLPPGLLQGLGGATAKQLARVELTPGGFGLHWEELDADLGVAGLASGVFGNGAWMSELARQAGSRTSARKAASARANGKLGGRPRKRQS